MSSEALTTIRTRWGSPLTEEALMDSCARDMFLKRIFLPTATLKKVTKVMSPSPPI